MSPSLGQKSLADMFWLTGRHKYLIFCSLFSQKLKKYFSESNFDKKKHFVKCQQFLKYQKYFVLSDVWWSKPGWPDWVIFCQLGYFWMPNVTFWKDEVDRRNCNNLGYFLFKQFFLHFHLNRQFQNMVCRYFEVS